MGPTCKFLRHLSLLQSIAMLHIVSEVICVFQAGVCCVCKPPITFAPNYTLKDVIRPACSTATQRDIMQYTEALCGGRRGSHTGEQTRTQRVLINILICAHLHQLGNKSHGLLVALCAAGWGFTITERARCTVRKYMEINTTRRKM